MRTNDFPAAGAVRTYRRDGVGVADPVLSDGRATMVPGVSERTNGATKFSHLDRPGIIAKTTDVSGTVVDSRRYDAFGLPISVTNPTNSQKGFASAFGIQEDSETGLKLMGHRYYDSGSGRFITRDRAGAGTNWYAYCDNNPLKAVDPDGDKPVFVGGSIWDRLAIILALENIARLPGGAWANEVLRGNRNYEITIVQKGGSKGSPYLPEISIDINDLNNYQYMTKNGGYEYFSWEQIVGHEFGHVFGHLTGSAQDEETVIKDWENPIAEALGLSPRKSHHDGKDIPKRRRRRIPFPHRMPLATKEGLS